MGGIGFAKSGMIISGIGKATSGANNAHARSDVLVSVDEAGGFVWEEDPGPAADKNVVVKSENHDAIIKLPIVIIVTDVYFNKSELQRFT